MTKETYKKSIIRFYPKGKLFHIQCKPNRNNVYFEFSPSIYLKINPEDNKKEIEGRTIVTETEMKLLREFLGH